MIVIVDEQYCTTKSTRVNTTPIEQVLFLIVQQPTAPSGFTVLYQTWQTFTDGHYKWPTICGLRGHSCLVQSMYSMYT